MSPAAALDPSRRLTQFKHTAWTVDDGAPSNILALAQTADGYLWIGSLDGLFRFDGVTFERVELKGGETSIWSLLAARDGGLWIGHASGRITVLNHGLETDASLPSSKFPVIKLVQDRSGDVWAQLGTFFHGLARFHQGKWTEIDARWGLNSRGYFDTLATADGRILVVDRIGIHVLNPGSHRFVETDIKPGEKTSFGLATSRSGEIWASETDVGVRKISTPVADQKLHLVGTPIQGTIGMVLQRVIFDRDGNLWGVAKGAGVYRITPQILAQGAAGTLPAKTTVERFATTDGLSSNSALPIFEDREGTIWVGTVRGLDRFRATNVAVEQHLPPTTEGHLTAVDHRGTIYVLDSNNLYRMHADGSPERLLTNLKGPQTLCESNDGTMWLTTYDEMYKSTGGPFTHVPRVGGTHNSYLDCVADPHGGLWFMRVANGFLHYARDGTTTDYPPPSGVKSEGPNIVTFDRQGRMIASMGHSSLVRIDSLRIHPLWNVKVDPKRRIVSLYQGARDLLIGTAGGLARMRDDHIAQLGARFPWLQSATGIVETPQGDTWLFAKKGVARVRTAALAQAFETKSAVLPHELFDFRDGLDGVSRVGESPSSVLRAADGKLWFRAEDNLFVIDPARLVRNTLPPPVSISAILYSGHRIRDPQNVSLPKATSAVQINYSALSLAVPERVQFRYRLEGVDADWVDPGSRRQAFYSNLKPGTYHFRVIASNNDGIWNRTGASLEFTIPPTFLQSWWFVALCILTMIIFLWFFYQMRLRQIAARVRAGMEVRLAERERIARELHDTMLQGIQGVIMRFQSVADKVPEDGQVKGLLEDALDRADAMLVDGRERVLQLRSEGGEDDLEKVFSDLGTRSTLDRPMDFKVTVLGHPRALEPAVREETARIGDQAIANAFQHSGGSAVRVIISYSEDALGVTVSDNGVGMPDGRDKTAIAEGHFGVLGMRERAERIGATLNLFARRAGGTEMTLNVPARLAYKNAAGEGSVWIRVRDRLGFDGFRAR
ncbi:sensor histidine kinase [Sphingomonas glacialis]|nr:sensor histidine kinase [Sphingomonas glacialis]